MNYMQQNSGAQQHAYPPQYQHPAQEPWNMQQPGYGLQEQQQWAAQQPGYPQEQWNAQQQDYAQAQWNVQQQNYPQQQQWNAQQPDYGAQAQQQQYYNPQAQQQWGAQQPDYGAQTQPQWDAQQNMHAQQAANLQLLQPNQAAYAEDHWELPTYTFPGAQPEQAPPQEAAVEPAEDEGEQKKSLRNSKIVNMIMNIFTFAFVIFVLAGSTIFAFSNNESKSLMGFRFYNVLTPSMQPFFDPGDMIFVKLVEPSEVQVGDVVTFSPSSRSTAFLTHRVIELLPADEDYPARMITQGDNNNAADAPTALTSVIGVHVFTIPLFGKVVDMLRSNLILVCVCFAAIFMLIVVVRAYFNTRKEKKNELASASSAPDVPDVSSLDITDFDIHDFS